MKQTIALQTPGRSDLDPVSYTHLRLRPQEPAQFRYRQYSLDERRRVRHCHNALF